MQDNQQAIKRHYSKLAREYLVLHPICEICESAPSEIIHHKRTRKTDLCNVAVFAACCKPCEKWVHQNPEQAKAIGMLL